MARLTRGAQKLIKTNTRFIVDPTVIPKLASGAEMAATLEVRADAVADATRALAPVGRSRDGEHYKDQIEATVQLGRGGFIGRVNARKFTSRWLEFGTIHMSARAPLRRGTEAAGLNLDGRRR